MKDFIEKFPKSPQTFSSFLQMKTVGFCKMSSEENITELTVLREQCYRISTYYSQNSLPGECQLKAIFDCSSNEEDLGAWW